MKEAEKEPSASVRQTGSQVFVYLCFGWQGSG